MLTKKNFLNGLKLLQLGHDKAEEYGRRNSSEGELLIKIKSTKVIGQKNIAG
jgi:hypothetical protein